MPVADAEKIQTAILAAIAVITAAAVLLIQASGAASDHLFGTIALWFTAMFIITHCALKIAIPRLAARGQAE